MRRRFVVNDRDSGEVVGEGAVDEQGRVWWSPQPRLSAQVLHRIEQDISAGQLSGTLRNLWWFEIDETALVRKLRLVN